MCVDYEPVNKHCPKDHFPLPRIDQIIDSTAGCDLLSFLDAYSGYNQIRMKEEDEEHTSFITPYGVFCYRIMPFGLKNTGATYQRMMQACLKEQIGRNVQVYVDDIVIKTYKADTLLEDLRETFTALNKYRIKLNPKKCTFGVPAGKLLGYMVSARGIEANPEKVRAIARMQEPTDIKGVQELTGRLAALSRFISRLGERTLPFYQLLSKGEIRVDRRSPQSIRGPEKYTLDPTNLGGAQRRGEVVPLRGSTQQRGKHNTRRRAHRRRQGPEHTEANILPQHAPDKISAAVPALPEATTGHH